MKLVDKIIVVGPISSLEPWKDEFVLSFGGKKELRYFSIQEAKNKNVLALESGGSNLLLFNYESVPAVANQLEAMVDNKTLLVFDEVHRVKRIRGYYAQAALQISRNSLYTIIMTGTPIPNSYKDIYNPLHLLFPDEYDDYFGFSEGELANLDSMQIERVNRLFKPFFCRTTKEDLQVTPPNPNQFYPVTATQEENELFNRVVQLYKRSPLALIIRLMQLESNPILLLQKLDESEVMDIFDSDESSVAYGNTMIDVDSISESDIRTRITKIENSSKFLKTVELIKGLVEQDKPIIVWCYFINTIMNLTTYLNENGIKAKSIFGDTSREDRIEYLNQFKNGEYKVLITNPNTLAEAISLHHICHDAIYLEYTYNLVHLLQSKDRIHRLGIPDNQYTQYYFMRTEYTLEGKNKVYSIGEQIYKRLEVKEGIMMEAINSDKIETMPSSEDDMRAVLEPLGLF